MEKFSTSERGTAYGRFPPHKRPNLVIYLPGCNLMVASNDSTPLLCVVGTMIIADWTDSGDGSKVLITRLCMIVATGSDAATRSLSQETLRVKAFMA